MSIQPIRAPRLHERIAQEIAQLIVAGTFKPGTRLPAERQLAQSLKVSRSSLREALSALELRGLLEIRLGSGAYVRRRATGPAPGRSAPAVQCMVGTLPPRVGLRPPVRRRRPGHPSTGSDRGVRRRRPVACGPR